MDSEEHILGLVQFSELEFFSLCSNLFIASVMVSCPWTGGCADTGGAAAAECCCWESAWLRD